MLQGSRTPPTVEDRTPRWRRTRRRARGGGEGHEEGAGLYDEGWG
jgi:hypothetical protein